MVGVGQVSPGNYEKSQYGSYPFERKAVSRPYESQHEHPIVDQQVAYTKEAIKTIFHKSRSIYTKKYIENHLLGDRLNKTGTPYIEMWHLIVDAFKNLEKRETSDAEKTHAAMKRIKNILIAYYDTPHKGMEISNAIRAIPKTLRKNKNIQRVLGTLVRNSSQLVSYYEQTKDTQQTFPGWGDITIDGAQPYMNNVNAEYGYDYMIASTNVKPGLLGEAKQFIKRD